MTKNKASQQSALHKKGAKSEVRQEKERQVSGKVLMTKQVEVRGTDTQNLIAMIKTNKKDRRLIVDLGPTEKFENSPVKKGNDIAVEGRMVHIRDHRFLVADKLKLNGKVMDIERAAQEKQHKSQNKKRAS